MKKSFAKKVLAVTLALMMVFMFAACGNEEAPSGDAQVLKIGGIGPVTGGAAVYGNAVKNGAEIAVEEINALGGDVQIEFRFEDDTHDAEVAVNAYNKLKDWGMQVLMGTTTTTPCIAVAAEAFGDRMFELTPSASSNQVTEGKDNVFQMCFTDPNQGTTAADYILDNNLGTKIAAIVNLSDAYSTGVYNAFVAELQARGTDVVYKGEYPDDTNTNFEVQLKAAQAAGADLVFLPIYYTPASLIMNQAKTMGYAPTFFGVDGMDGILTLEGFDTSLADGVMLMTPFNPWSEDEAVASFVSKYEEKYGETPNQFAADAYDCIYAIYNAFLAAGCSVSDDTATICEAMVPYFTSEFTMDGLTGKSMTWGTNGEVSKAPVVCVIQDAIYVDR